VMKTLPPNTPHCTSVCIDPSHEHELIKQHVRRRPKRERKTKGVKDESCKENNLEEEFDQISPNTSYRSVGLQVEPPVYEEYHSSSMAALIAAAAQAVAVPIPEAESEHAGMSEYPTSSRNMESHVPVDIPSHMPSVVPMDIPSHVAMENSHVTMENSHIVMENSRVGMDSQHAVMDSHHVTMDTHHTTDIMAGGHIDSTTYTMDSGVVREIPSYKMDGLSEEESVAMEANVVRELAEGVAMVTEQQIEAAQEKFEEIPDQIQNNAGNLEIKTETVSIKEESV